MELICPECGEDVRAGIPGDAKALWPTDRKFYHHRAGRTGLCPVVGLDANGNSSYIPALPIEKRARRR